MQISTGSRLGPYEVEKVLGAGGMGEVYQAKDTRLHRSVAIKILLSGVSSDPQHLLRFEQESRAASAINHPNVIAVYDVGIHEGYPFLVVELLEGDTLRVAIKTQMLSAHTALQYAVQIASGLAAAHERGIIHRDLKPENIFVTRDGIAKILDFGLAKLSPQSDTETSTATTIAGTSPGMILGTVAYMSPEQARGAEIDFRSDIFSLGVVMFEMFAGQRPFRGTTHADLISSILRDEPEYSLISGPPELLRVLVHCLEKNPAERFQSTRDLTFSLRMIEGNLFAGTESGEHRFPTGEADTPSIAVLPFHDLSFEKDQEYFCDGIAEELITALTKIPGLRVASRSSGFQYKDHRTDIREIGEQLNVATILEGSVRKAGRRIRITAELIDASTGYHLWSEKFDRDLDDIFAIQDEIAGTIVNTLKIQLIEPKEQKLIRRYTANMEAYNLYLKGRHHWKDRSHAALNKAEKCFREAIALDPQYALAFAGLADCNSLYGFYAFERPEEVYPKAIHSAEEALRIDPMLPEGYLALGGAYLYFDFDWEKGEKAILKSLELNPDFALGHCWYSGFLNLAGRYEEGHYQIRKALELDPLSPLFSSFRGFSFYLQRQYDQAVQESQKTLEISPDFLLALWYAGLAHLKKARYEQAIDFLNRAVRVSDGSTFFMAYVAMAEGLSGNTAEAEKILSEMKTRSATEYVAPLHFARAYLGLHREEEALEELEKAYAERNVLIYLPYSPEFDDIRAHPRVQALVDRIYQGRQ